MYIFHTLIGMRDTVNTARSKGRGKMVKKLVPAEVYTLLKHDF